MPYSNHRGVLKSIITFTTPKSLYPHLEVDKLKDRFNKVLVFYIGEDFGEFPSTEGYTKKDWEHLESDCEDPALYKFMMRAIDAVVEYNDRWAKRFADRGFTDVEAILQAPKFGGKVFCVAGIVKGFEPNIIVVPKMAGVY